MAPIYAVLSEYKLNGESSELNDARFSQQCSLVHRLIIARGFFNSSREALKNYCARSGCVEIKLKMLIYSM